MVGPILQDCVRSAYRKRPGRDYDRKSWRRFTLGEISGSDLVLSFRLALTALAEAVRQPNSAGFRIQDKDMLNPASSARVSLSLFRIRIDPDRRGTQDLAGVRRGLQVRSLSTSASQVPSFLIQDGMTEAQADERLTVVQKLYAAYPLFRQQLQAISFDSLYRSTNQTRFTSEANASP